MCGIIGGFAPKSQIEQGLNALHHRGPDHAAMHSVGSITLGHTRLAILDLDVRSNQPFLYRDLAVVFNGEIWNYRFIRAELFGLGYQFKTDGDTEVIAAALHCWGVEALSKLNGMFAIAWAQNDEHLYLARDRFGEIPLHIAKQKPFLFASELKALKTIGGHPKSFDHIQPGHYAIVSKSGIRIKSYYDIPLVARAVDLPTASAELFNKIQAGTIERSISDVPVCTLLSGGIDSAAVALHLKEVFPNLVAYVAVMNPQSRDLKCARQFAAESGIELREVKIPIPTATDLTTIIEIIEMPYKAQVEIGWACLHLAKQIQADGFKVTFSGEGSDELWASYGFAYHALKTENWHAYRKKLFLAQAEKNFARCNKIFMRHSIECRLPFLNPSLVEYAISLPQDVVHVGTSKKAVIQSAYRGRLLRSITDRPKLAFQDGLGLKEEISKVIAQPKRFYGAEFKKIYG